MTLEENQNKMSNNLFIQSFAGISEKKATVNNETVLSFPDNDISKNIELVYQYLSLSYRRFHKMDNMCKLGFLTLELLQSAGIEMTCSPYEKALILSNRHSSLETDNNYQDTILNLPSPATFVYTLPNIVLGEMAIRHNIKGEQAFFVDDDFNSEFLDVYINIIFAQNLCKYCICGWVDVFDGHYYAVLILVSKASSEMQFTASNISAIFNKNKV